MTYDLIIADRLFSSWSLRGWLMFEEFDIPYRTHIAGLSSGTFENDLRPYYPSHMVPVIRTPQGDILGESLAIAETLAERHPFAGLWPPDEPPRILARWLVAEMHAGFSALRTDCPMQLQHQYKGFEPSEKVLADLARIQELWSLAHERHGQSGPWLFGSYSLADVFFAPVAARIAGYDLAVNDDAAHYVSCHLKSGAFRRWRAMGKTVTYNDPQPYALDLPTQEWPGPTPINATLASGPSENKSCPYSGKPVTDFLIIGDRIFGFCNPYCRTKLCLTRQHGLHS